MKYAVDEKLQENFWLNEFLASNDTQVPTPRVLFNINRVAVKLQLLRNMTGSITINSGYRGTAFNKRINGSSNSHHLTGVAVDIRFDWRPWTRESLTRVLQVLGFTNVNFYWDSSRKNLVWIHADIGPTWNGLEFNYRDMDANTQKVITR